MNLSPIKEIRERKKSSEQERETHRCLMHIEPKLHSLLGLVPSMKSTIFMKNTPSKRRKKKKEEEIEMLMSSVQ
jgi:hypothetical protein